MNKTAEYIRSGNCLKFNKKQFSSLLRLINECRKFQCKLDYVRDGDTDPSSNRLPFQKLFYPWVE